MASTQREHKQTEAEIFYQALLARDRRFDGRFFTGVRTTGIYCRPICPARPPLFKNVRFFPTAAGAEEAGFRPCQRCRPESAPGTPAWLGSSATVGRALRLLRSGEELEGGVAALAARLGMGERRLRQLFAEHLGASPQAVLRVGRLDFARRLIDETTLPLSEVAFAAGFGSIRRFNDAVLGRFGRSPSELRRRRSERARLADADDGALLLRLPYRPPYAWDALLRFLADRAIPGVESVVDGRYLRTVALPDCEGHLEVEDAPTEGCLRLRLSLHSTSGGAHLGPSLMSAVERVRTQFDLEADPLTIAATLERDGRLAPLLADCPGLRVPGGWDGFELAIRAILGQQVSVKGATTLSGRLVQRFGRPLRHPAGAGGCLTHTFPTAAVLAEGDLTTIGIPGSRAAALRLVAAKVAAGELVLGSFSDSERTIAALLAIPGIGPWTAAYIAMRVLRDPDGFPATDLVLRRMLPAGDRQGETFRPWRAYAAMYLWNSSGNADSNLNHAQKKELL